MVNVMENKIRVKCRCGAILILKDTGQDASARIVTCPRCKTKALLSELEKVGDIKKQAFTGPDEETEYEERTERRTSKDIKQKASLLDLATAKTYSLKMGVNLIGRKTYKVDSVADIPLETNDMGVSRAHFYVELMQTPQLTKACVYNARNKNATYINSDILGAGEKMIIKSGDIISMSDTKIKFLLE